MDARHGLPLLILALLALGCPIDPDDDDDTGDDDVGDDDTGDDDTADDDTADELDQYILEEMEQTHIPGLAASVVVDGEIVWSRGYGWADIDAERAVTPDTEFMLASVSKTITAVALMHLFDTGAFSLDDDVDDYLTFAVDHPTAPEVPITFRQLLTHTSSIRDNWNVMGSLYVDGDSPIPLGEFLEDFLSPGGAYYDADANYYKLPPGSVYRYSNIGASLAGYLVEAISGTPFDQYCEQHVFGPLQMDGAGWHLADVDVDQLAVPYSWAGSQYNAHEHYGYPDYPDGALRCDVDELSNFLIHFIEDGSFGAETILEPATVAEMKTVQYPKIDAWQGLIWYYTTIGGDEVLGHNGGDDGVSTDMYYRTDDEVGVIVLTNGDSVEGGGAMVRIQERLYDEAANF